MCFNVSVRVVDDAPCYIFFCTVPAASVPFCLFLSHATIWSSWGWGWGWGMGEGVARMSSWRSGFPCDRCLNGLKVSVCCVFQSCSLPLFPIDLMTSILANPFDVLFRWYDDGHIVLHTMRCDARTRKEVRFVLVSLVSFLMRGDPSSFVFLVSSFHVMCELGY